MHEEKKQGGIGAYEDPVQCLWVMGRRQHRGILHVVLQVPKLLQSHATDVDDVVTLRNRCLGVFTVYGRAERHDKARQ